MTRSHLSTLCPCYLWRKAISWTLHWIQFLLKSKSTEHINKTNYLSYTSVATRVQNKLICCRNWTCPRTSPVVMHLSDSHLAEFQCWWPLLLLLYPKKFEYTSLYHCTFGGNCCFCHTMWNLTFDPAFFVLKTVFVNINASKQWSSKKPQDQHSVLWLLFWRNSLIVSEKSYFL